MAHLLKFAAACCGNLYSSALASKMFSISTALCSIFLMYFFLKGVVAQVGLACRQQHSWEAACCCCLAFQMREMAAPLKHGTLQRLHPIRHAVLLADTTEMHDTRQSMLCANLSLDSAFHVWHDVYDRCDSCKDCWDRVFVNGYTW